MYKKLLLILLILIVAIFGLSNSIRSATYSISSTIKIAFIDTKDKIKSSYNQHFQQAQQIEQLQKKLQDYEQVKIQRDILHADINVLLKLLNHDIRQSLPKVYMARILSFVSAGNFNRLWLDSDIAIDNDDNVYGLIKDGVSFGVASTDNGRLIAYLNGDIKCSYSVYIGNSKILGFLTNDKNQNISVRFIPSWFNIKVGDKVVTSGLDNIFPYNIPVGVVKQVNEEYGHLSVEIDMYAKGKGSDYVWLVDHNIQNKTTENHIEHKSNLTSGGAFSSEIGGVRKTQARSKEANSRQE